METPAPAAPEMSAAPPVPAPPPVALPPTAAAATVVTPLPNTAAAIADLCLLAGMPERTADLLHRGISIDDARRELLAAKASASVEIRSHLALAPASGSSAASGSASGSASLEHNPVVKAAQARAAFARAQT